MHAVTFIYALCDPDSLKVRYIGKANTPNIRLVEHCRNARKGSRTHLYVWIRALLRANKRPVVRLLRQVAACDWQEWEIRYISSAKMLGFDLTNGTEGGDGNHNPSLETRTKWSQMRTGKGNPNFGRTFVTSEETKAKLRIAMKGRFVSEVTRKKLGLRALGRYHRPESIRRMRLAKLGKSHKSVPCPEEKKAQLSVSMIKAWESGTFANRKPKRWYRKPVQA